MNPKHIRHREYPPICRKVSISCNGIADMRPAGCGGDSEPFNLCRIFGFLMGERGGVVKTIKEKE